MRWDHLEGCDIDMIWQLMTFLYKFDLILENEWHELVDVWITEVVRHEG